MVSLLFACAAFLGQDGRGLEILHQIPPVAELSCLSDRRERSRILSSTEARIRQFAGLPKMLQRYSLHMFAEECKQRIVKWNGGRIVHFPKGPPLKDLPRPFFSGRPDFGTAEVLSIYKGKEPGLMLPCSCEFLRASSGHLVLDYDSVAEMGPCVPRPIYSYDEVMKGDELVRRGFYDLEKPVEPRARIGDKSLCKFRVSPGTAKGVLQGFVFRVINVSNKPIHVAQPQLNISVGYKIFGWPADAVKTYVTPLVIIRADPLKPAEEATASCDIEQITKGLPIGRTIGVQFSYDDAMFNDVAQSHGSLERSDVRKAILGPRFWLKRERAGVRLVKSAIGAKARVKPGKAKD